MHQNCRSCQTQFEITSDDLAFYDKISPVFNGQKYLVAPPTLCPDCRLQRRLNWRTELHLFWRTSSKSGQQILSHYPKESPMQVYSNEEWWSDDWDPFTYGQNFDFSKPFFTQFKELLNKVPVQNLSTEGNENCDYINNASWNKNCYLIAGAAKDENCYYNKSIINCSDCLDCNFVTSCELCYDCINCHKCYHLSYSQNCQNCSDSLFLQDCSNCKNCFGCINQNNKEYMYFNQQLTKEQYISSIQQFELHKRSEVQKLQKLFYDFSLKFPRKSILGSMNENVSGNCINNSRNSFYCYDVEQLEDCKHCIKILNSKNCMDCFTWGMTSENCYENLEVGDDSYQVLFAASLFNCANSLYSTNCAHCEHILGCASLRNKKYCIFNKQYTKEDYFKLASLIIEHMQSTGEWGEFFPMSVCPFNYNQSIAQDSFPLNESKATNLGATWASEQTHSRPSDAPNISDSIEDVDQNICTTTLYSSKSNKPFKIIPQELKFYKENNIPLPTTTFYERILERLHKRNPRKLHNRTCSKCQTSIQTTFAPDRPEIVYCEQCYLDTVY